MAGRLNQLTSPLASPTGVVVGMNGRNGSVPAQSAGAVLPPRMLRIISAPTPSHAAAVALVNGLAGVNGVSGGGGSIGSIDAFATANGSATGSNSVPPTPILMVRQPEMRSARPHRATGAVLPPLKLFTRIGSNGGSGGAGTNGVAATPTAAGSAAGAVASNAGVPPTSAGAGGAMADSGTPPQPHSAGGSARGGGTRRSGHNSASASRDFAVPDSSDRPPPLLVTASSGAAAIEPAPTDPAIALPPTPVHLAAIIEPASPAHSAAPGAAGSSVFGSGSGSGAGGPISGPGSAEMDRHRSQLPLLVLKGSSGGTEMLPHHAISIGPDQSLLAAPSFAAPEPIPDHQLLNPSRRPSVVVTNDLIATLPSQPTDRD